MFDKIVTVLKANPDVVKKVGIGLGITVGAIVVAVVLKKYAAYEILGDTAEEVASNIT